MSKTNKAFYQNPLFLIVVAIGAAAIGAFVVNLMGGSSGEGTEISKEISSEDLVVSNRFQGPEFGEVTVSGKNLTPYAPGVDESVGEFVPDVTAQSFLDGSEVKLEAGQARVLVFAAHWCQYCQEELPSIKSWFSANELPSDVEVVVVQSSVRPNSNNYPPSKWFSTLDWPTTVVSDDNKGTFLKAYGISGFPVVVGVHADGSLAVRGMGFAQTLEIVSPSS